jgi:hypothetical protein
MKVKFYCDSGENIHSCREEKVDLIEDWGMTEEECSSLSEEELNKLAMEWAWERLEVGCEVL